MGVATAGTAKLDLKLFAVATAAGAPSPEPRDLVAVFHRWIQTSRLPGELLIDVADYSHVHHGPGVLLVAHGAVYAWDGESGRPGLLYSRRRPADSAGSGFALSALLRRALVAARELETDLPAVAVTGQELVLRVNDRLATADAAAAEGALRDELAPLLAELFPGDDVSVERSGGSRERLTLTVKAPRDPGLAALLDRLGAAA